MTDALAYMRRVLGERWSGWERRSHLARVFHLSVQGGEREWVRLHRLAKALVGVLGVELLVKDLGSPSWQKHVAAEQALEFCGRMSAAGHRVELIEPTSNTSPDVRVSLVERPITVEFKALHDPDEMSPWNEFFDALYARLFQHRQVAELFPFAAVFLDPALDHVEEVADALTAIVLNGDEESHDLPRGSGTARYVPDESGPRGARIPAEQRDDGDRVIANLGGKYRRQLRVVDGPSLLVVLTKNMFPAPGRLRDAVPRIVDALRDALATETSISSLLLHEEPFEPPHRALLNIEGDWRFAMGATEGRARTALLVENSSAAHELTEPELDVLIGRDMCW